MIPARNIARAILDSACLLLLAIPVTPMLLLINPAEMWIYLSVDLPFDLCDVWTF